MRPTDSLREHMHDRDHVDRRIRKGDGNFISKILARSEFKSLVNVYHHSYSLKTVVL